MIQPPAFSLKITDFNFIVKNNIMPLQVLSMLLVKGNQVEFHQKSRYSNKCECWVGGRPIAYLQGVQAIWLCTQLDMERTLYGYITDVRGKNALTKITIDVYFSLQQTAPFEQPPNLQNNLDQEKMPEANKPPDLERVKPKSNSSGSKQLVVPKHPLTGVAFRSQKNKPMTFRQQSGKSGVYCIYQKNFKSYVGQSKDISRRWFEHVHSLNEGRHHNPQLQQDWDLLGACSFVFKVITYCEPEELERTETHYINVMLEMRLAYNVPPELIEAAISRNSENDKFNNTESMTECSLEAKGNNDFPGLTVVDLAPRKDKQPNQQIHRPEIYANSCNSLHEVSNIRQTETAVEIESNTLVPATNKPESNVYRTCNEFCVSETPSCSDNRDLQSEELKICVSSEKKFRTWLNWIANNKTIMAFAAWFSYRCYERWKHLEMLENKGQLLPDDSGKADH